MLTHPTLDQLRALGLYGMAKAFESLGGLRRQTRSVTPNGLACFLITN